MKKEYGYICKHDECTPETNLFPHAIGTVCVDGSLLVPSRPYPFGGILSTNKLIHAPASRHHGRWRTGVHAVSFPIHALSWCDRHHMEHINDRVVDSLHPKGCPCGQAKNGNGKAEGAPVLVAQSVFSLTAGLFS